MRLSKWGYHADFVVYPVLIGYLALRSLWHATPQAEETWLAATAAGLLGWTALEYAIHRWLLHHVPPFRRLHALHHERPAALIGTPTWLSALLFLLLWEVAVHEFPIAAVDGIGVGMMAGYLAYAFVHDAVHHRRARPGSWLYYAKLRHARHHRPLATGDFGVSTGVWDWALGHKDARTIPASKLTQ